MSNEPQAPSVGEADARAGWILPALAGVLAFYVLWMGETLAWNHQAGHYWYFLAPWWTPTSLKFLAIAALAAAGFRFLGARFRGGAAWTLAAVLLGGSSGVLARRGASWAASAVGFDHPSFMFRLKEFGDLFPFALGATVRGGMRAPSISWASPAARTGSAC
jgi:hypothetical protein